MKSAALHFLAILGTTGLSCLAHGGYLWHLQPEEARFEAKILLENSSQNEVTVLFSAPDGSQTAVRVPGGETSQVDPRTFGKAAYLAYETASPLLKVRLRYSFGPTPVELMPQERPATLLHFRSQSPSAWLGFALVNMGQTPCTVSLHFQGKSGEGASTRELVEQLSPGQPAVVGLSLADISWGGDRPFDDLATGTPGAFVVSSSQPILCMALTSSWLGTIQPLLAQGSWSKEIHARISGGFAGIDEVLVIREGVLTFQGRSVALPERTALIDAIFEQDWSARTIARRGARCCDFFEVSFTVLNGDSYNTFEYNDDDATKDERIAPIHEVVASLYRLAEELTGINSLPF
jgi:hypothetical protein